MLQRTIHIAVQYELWYKHVMPHSQNPQDSSLFNSKNTELQQLQQEFADLEGEELLHAVYQYFGKRMAVQTSFGRDAGITLSMISRIDPEIPVLFADTGQHFPETLQYAEKLKNELGLKDVRNLKPSDADLAMNDPNSNLYDSDPDSCCYIRKIKPMTQELAKGEFDIIVTGRSRGQDETRKALQTIELGNDGLFRVNPLANWTKEQRVAALEGIPQTTLHAGYTSIGCKPCTRAIAPGEDDRAGRWPDKPKTVCRLNDKQEDMQPLYQIKLGKFFGRENQRR